MVTLELTFHSFLSLCWTPSPALVGATKEEAEAAECESAMMAASVGSGVR